MDSSYLNILTFLLTTLLYYWFKKDPTYATVSNQQAYEDFTKSNYMYLVIYLLLVMLVQFIVNASILSKNCGGNISENMGASGMFTFIPWTLIFGVMIVILVLYPGFKSAFSDVIGYYWISSSANELLVNLLINQDVEGSMANPGPSTDIDTSNASSSNTSSNASSNASSNKVPRSSEIELTDTNKGKNKGNDKGNDTVNQTVITSITPQGGLDNLYGGRQKGGQLAQEQIRKAADLILKICGNTSILINQMTTRNFAQYWSLLEPLKKPQYQGSRGDDIRDQLFNLVVKKDNIGEIMWYIYTGLLLTSVVQLKITTRGCSMNPKTMEENYKKFRAKEDALQKQNAATANTTYTL